jgi:hypothetical protein
MAITSNQNIVQLPTSTDSEAEIRGQSHHSWFATDTARNANYALQNKASVVLASGHGLSISTDTSAYTYSHFLGQSIISHCIAWWPLSHNLTIEWAFRAAYNPAVGTGGLITVYVCDQGWLTNAPPSECLYVTGTETVANVSWNNLTGEANGEYRGSVTVNFPLKKDSMAHIYVQNNPSIVFGSYVFWAQITP